MRLWDIGNGKCIRVLNGHQSVVSSVALSDEQAMLQGDKTLVCDAAVADARRRKHTSGVDALHLPGVLENVTELSREEFHLHVRQLKVCQRRDCLYLRPWESGKHGRC